MNLLKRGTLRYEQQFHNDLGSAEDPSAVAAYLRAPDGTWSTLAAIKDIPAVT